MNHKEEYQKLVADIKKRRKELGMPFDNGTLANQLGISSTHFASLVGESGHVTAKHLTKLKLAFSKDFENRSEEPSWEYVLKISLAALLKNDDSHTRSLNEILKTGAKHSAELEQILTNQADQGEVMAYLQSEIISRLDQIQRALRTSSKGAEPVSGKGTTSVSDKKGRVKT